MRIRNKIALIFVMVTAVTLLLLSIFIYLFSLQNTHEYFFTRLKVRSSIALHAYLDGGSSDAMRELRQRHLQLLPDEKDFIVDYDSVLTGKQKKPSEMDVFYQTVFENGYAEYECDFIYYVGMSEKSSPKKIGVASAFNEEGADQMLSLRRLLLIGFFLSCSFVFALGRLLAAQIIKPVSDIIEDVKRINASSLDKRLTAAKGTDEIAALAQTFNSMLDRVHTAFQLQGNFISNASHELRTPLTTILGESDFLLSGDRDKDVRRQSILAIHTEAEKLKDLTASLLELSQVDFNGKQQTLEAISIDLLLMKIKNQINKRDAGNNLQIVISEIPESPDALVLMCIPSWIELALLNIITNAIKYSNNKEVTVTLSASNENLTITIRDFGIGISENDLAHVFELFFRGSNSKPYAGHGIGLPLADKIIRLHGGRILINSKPDLGTTVTILFGHERIKKR